MGFIVSIVILLFALFILHWIISSAIDSSDMARDIKEIKEYLLQNKGKNSNKKLDILQDNGIYTNQENVLEQDQRNNECIEECPACSAKNNISDTVCRSCGLALRDE